MTSLFTLASFTTGLDAKRGRGWRSGVVEGILGRRVDLKAMGRQAYTQPPGAGGRGGAARC